MYRSGLRIHEALALGESDLDQRRGSLLVRPGKGGRRREVGTDDWAWEHVQPWLTARSLPRSRSGPPCSWPTSTSAPSTTLSTPSGTPPILRVPDDRPHVVTYGLNWPLPASELLPVRFSPSA